jgi:GTP-binding protein
VSGLHVRVSRLQLDPVSACSGGRVLQAGISPPTFVFFVNDPALIGDDYKRYMERALRDNIGLSGTPIRLLWRGKPQRERAPPRKAAGDADAE